MSKKREEEYNRESQNLHMEDPMAEATTQKKVLAELESLYIVLINRERNHLPEEEVSQDAQQILALLPQRVSGLKVGDVTYFRKGEYKSHEKVLRLENVRFIFQGKFS